MAQIKDIAPMVPVRDVEKTAKFYEDILDFKTRFIAEDKSFGIVEHSGCAIHLQKTDDDAALKATAEQIASYVWVEDLDELYNSLKGGLDGLPEGRFRKPFNQPYGMREFHVKDPDGFLLFFGEYIS